MDIKNENLNANDPRLESWVNVDDGSDFPIQNLPLGVFKNDELGYRVCSAIGDYVIDLSVCLSLGFFDGMDLHKDLFQNRYFNDLIALGNDRIAELRNRLAGILKKGSNAEHQSDRFLIHMDKVEMVLPVKIGDYTDFYSSIEHATNVGKMFRDPENALLPNWKHLPVGYHGRASSIVCSGTDIKRPSGQMKPADAPPVYGKSKLLDFELEMGFVIGKSNDLGEPIPIEEASNHVAGLMLFNDWSARDIQKWEYVPLGPFLGKNFASTVSPWLICLSALEPFRVEGPKQEPEVLDYLKIDGNNNFDVNLTVAIQPPEGEETQVCRSNFKYMYWNMWQQLAHHTVNGCNAQVGDLYASGTISGKSPESYGSMLELSWRGSKPLQLKDGTERKFINDGDTVTMRAWCEKDGVRIGFGDCTGKIIS